MQIQAIIQEIVCIIDEDGSDRFDISKVGAYSRWSSSLYRHVPNSVQMTIRNVYLTLVEFNLTMNIKTYFKHWNGRFDQSFQRRDSWGNSQLDWRQLLTLESLQLHINYCMTNNQTPLGTRTGRLQWKSDRTVRVPLNIILYDPY